MFALVDCNTFYASCEAIFNPAIRDKPVVVLSNNDGCIISCNARARQLQIPAYQPLYQVKDLLEKHKVHIFSSNYELYGDISSRIMNLLAKQAMALEVYSIDEAFLRLPEQGLQQQGEHIKQLLWQQVRMPACVGIAPTKTLSKLANHAAKTIPQLEGVCVADNQEKIHWLLSHSSVKDVWGIGSRLAQKLAGMNIHTAQDLALAEPKLLRRRFSVVLEKTQRELKGESCLPLDLIPQPRQHIISTRSFAYKITDCRELEQAISLYAARACDKLRRQHGLCASLWVYAESSRQQGRHFYRQRFVKLPYLSNDTRLVAQYAARAIRQLYRPGIRFKKCGIGLLDIQTQHYEQGDFFQQRQDARSHRLMQLMDTVNQRYGSQTLGLANTGIQPRWSMRRDYKSPSYTTRWEDIPRVRC